MNELHRDDDEGRVSIAVYVTRFKIETRLQYIILPPLP